METYQEKYEKWLTDSAISEEDKQEIMNRYEEANGDWEYIFENIKDEKKRKIVTRLFTEN